MKRKRTSISDKVQALVLTACRRRCCLCVFLHQRDEERPGQIAHLNRDAGDSRFENLVFLCLEHHDQYDSRTSQSKGLSSIEVRHWRDVLYSRYPKSELMNDDVLPQTEVLESPSPTSRYDEIMKDSNYGLEFLDRPWRYPLWQVASQPDLFAYKVAGGFDGICLVERIDLPDGRIVVACTEVPGNPGQSITNCVETLCLQICERFDIRADKLVWLEHYEMELDKWRLVSFGTMPPEGPFADPEWTDMTPETWADLKLRPKRRMKARVGNQCESRLRKLFRWPSATTRI